MPNRQKFADKILQVIIFFLPTQLGYHFWPEWAHIFGIRVDYFSPTLYLSDLLIGVYLLLRTPDIFKRKNPRALGLIILLMLLVIINIMVSVNQPVSIYFWLRITEMVLFGVAVATTHRDQIKKLIYKPLLVSLVVFSTIGIIQTVRGQTLGGIFYFLGERSFNATTPGIASVYTLGNTLLRAYSTFPHPNAFAGYLLVGTIIFLWAKDKVKFSKADWAALVLVFLGMGLTFSFSAVLCLVFLATFYFGVRNNYLGIIKTALILLVLISIASTVVGPYLLNPKNNLTESVERRIELSQVAGKIVSKNLLFGVGLGGFIKLLPQTGPTTGSSWWLQPVHNIYLLLLSEVGLVGLLVALFLFVKTISRKPAEKLFLLSIMAVLITGGLDHYWMTLQQNQVLLSLLLALFFI